ncbi:uncharacterized protein EMH_0038970 [Eimeria mitis]|uniref:SCP domain-containing protein n=1 Tax=Eimeria mitis TaxID=44415 RepID=U6JVZ1_9EIME|nr:uncharacterized protein EMH_0038970 [Eimeria mitis]CDJ28227.1 hypothetical protein EMH_0038970 [Eimeria mitis]
MPVSKGPFSTGRESREELLKKAEKMFAEVDAEAKQQSEFKQPPLPELTPRDYISAEEQSEFKQPPLPELTPRDYISAEEKAAEANPSIDRSIPAEHLVRGIEVIKGVAKKYSTPHNYFPGNTLRLQSAVNDDPKGGKEFITAIEGELRSIPEAAKEELGRRMMSSAKLMIDPKEKVACVEYDTGLTDRVYSKEGEVGAVGYGVRIRLSQKYNAQSGGCKGDLQSESVSQWSNSAIPDIKGGLGENLYTACSIGELPRDVVDAWSGEGNCFRYGKIGNPCTGVLGPKCSIEAHAEGLMTGHFTATVWNDSRELGCAYVVCKRECQNNRPLLLVGCQYTPAGNIVGQAPFPKETAVKLQSFYPQLLPGAPEDPEQIKKCEEFRKEMKMKNPRVDLVEKSKNT